ncbi:MAG: extracellular solute-binding protein, partial [Acidisphaera sp.]|nr:extracellular solute-binding protein [Acidisphaera sp.]
MSPLPARLRPVTRRRVLAGLLTAPFLLAASRAVAADALRVTAYDGFVPPPIQQRFTAETGIPIRIRPAASQAPELALLTAERDHPVTDLCTVVGSRLHQFVEAGIIEPLETARLRHWDRLNPLYAEAAWNRVNGAVMGVPLVIGANVLVYDRREVAPAPDSWGAMFDGRYRGRTTYDVEDFLLCTMLLQGTDPTFVSYLGDPDAARRAVAAARDRLIANKAQAVRFFDEGGELQQILLGGDAVLAQTYSSAPARLILAGQPFRRVVPREGSMAFVYTFAVVKGAPNRDAAYRFLDTLLGTPGAEAMVTRSAGYASTFRDAGVGLTELERAAYGMPEDALGRLRFARFEGQALSSALIDRAVEEVKA